MTRVNIKDVQVIAPNFKRRLSGVTATVVRLVPLQSAQIRIAATGPVMPAHVPQIPLRQLITMPRRGPDGARVWHARRNLEMDLPNKIETALDCTKEISNAISRTAKIIRQLAMPVDFAAVFPCIFEQLCLTGVLMRTQA